MTAAFYVTVFALMGGADAGEAALLLSVLRPDHERRADEHGDRAPVRPPGQRIRRFCPPTQRTFAAAGVVDVRGRMCRGGACAFSCLGACCRPRSAGCSRTFGLPWCCSQPCRLHSGLCFIMEEYNEGNPAPCCLRRFAEILSPDFARVSLQYIKYCRENAPHPGRKICSQIAPCQMMRYCLRFPACPQADQDIWESNMSKITKNSGCLGGGAAECGQIHHDQQAGRAEGCHCVEQTPDHRARASRAC